MRCDGPLMAKVGQIGSPLVDQITDLCRFETYTATYGIRTLPLDVDCFDNPDQFDCRGTAWP